MRSILRSAFVDPLIVSLNCVPLRSNRTASMTVQVEHPVPTRESQEQRHGSGDAGGDRGGKQPFHRVTLGERAAYLSR
jgi:hypothetical protein